MFSHENDENLNAKLDSKSRLIILDTKSTAIIDQHIAKAKAEFGATLTISTRKMVNFLLQSRTVKLTAEELDEIRFRFTNRIKFLRLVVAEAKRAQREGRPYSIEEKLEFLRTLGVRDHRGAPKARRGRPPKRMIPDASAKNGENPEVEAAVNSRPNEQAENRSDLEKGDDSVSPDIGNSD